MKKIYTLITVVCIFNLANGASKTSEHETDSSLFEDMVFIPGGSIKISSNENTKVEYTACSYWMKENEVSVKEYHEYLDFLKNDTSEAHYRSVIALYQQEPIENYIQTRYRAALPDYSKAPHRNYFSSKKYQDYPMVGITLKQAMMYCQWLSSTKFKSPTAEGTTVHTYRVPSKAEWLYSAFRGDSVIHISKLPIKNPNSLGLYNMNDDILEWTLSQDKIISGLSGSRKVVVEIPGANDTIIDMNNIQGVGIKHFNPYLFPDVIFKPIPYVVGGGDSKTGYKLLDNTQAYKNVGFRYICIPIDDDL